MPKRTPGSENRVLHVCKLLNRRRVRYLLAGGVAANLHGSVRATKDVDILIPRDIANAERLVAALSDLPFGIAAELSPAELVENPVTIVGDDPRVDVLTVAFSVTFDRAWPNRVVRRIGGVRLPYLGLNDLLESKRTGRPSDEADIVALRNLREFEI